MLTAEEQIQMDRVKLELSRVEPLINRKMDRIREIKKEIRALTPAVTPEAKAQVKLLKEEWDRLDKEKNEFKSDRYALWAEQRDLDLKAASTD